MARTRYVIGNWKMNGSVSFADDWLTAVSATAGNNAATKVVVCPPFPLITGMTSRTAVAVGAQDCCHTSRCGAYTGEVSAELLRDLGCEFVLVGHSERRVQHCESDTTVSAKAEAAWGMGLQPVVCVGESLEIRESGSALEYVGRQLLDSIFDDFDSGCLVAYEPVWAIGTGRVAGLDEIDAMHSHLVSVLQTGTGLPEDEITILYGGSVKADNAAEILDLPSVGGVLVGGASLDAAQFCAIIDAASRKS